MKHWQKSKPNGQNVSPYDSFGTFLTFYPKMNDKFARLKAIAAGGELNQMPTMMPAIWNHEVNKPLIGEIKGFSNFHHER